MVNIYTDQVIINEGDSFPGNVIVTPDGQKVPLTYNDIDEALKAGRDVILRMPYDKGCYEVFPLAAYFFDTELNDYRASFGGCNGRVEFIAPDADAEFEIYPQ